MTCFYCGESDQRKLKPSTNFQGSRVLRCVKAWDCHKRRVQQARIRARAL